MILQISNASLHYLVKRQCLNSDQIQHRNPHGKGRVSRAAATLPAPQSPLSQFLGTRTYIHIVEPRTTKFDKITHLGKRHVFIVEHGPQLKGLAPQRTPTRQRNFARWGVTFYRVHHNPRQGLGIRGSKFYQLITHAPTVGRKHMLKRDLFAIAKLFADAKKHVDKLKRLFWSVIQIVTKKRRCKLCSSVSVSECRYS